MRLCEKEGEKIIKYYKHTRPQTHSHKHKPNVALLKCTDYMHTNMHTYI